MRSIKFRVWLDEFNKMFYDVGLIGGELYVNIDGKGYDVVGDCMDFKLMQFTGLYDRNGKEIYEGDILKLVLVDWSDVPEDIFTVSSEQFVEDVCYLKSIIANAIEVESQTDCIEVIGNIYENPELLEGEK